MTVSMRVMSAGDGYKYLLRSVAAGDGDRSLSTPLTRYYAEEGTPPGRWLGSGLGGPWGARLEAVNAALSKWAVESPAVPWGADMSPDTVVLAMRAHARGDIDLVAPMSVNLHLIDSRLAEVEPVTYMARMTAERCTIEKAPVPSPADADVVATTADWKACVIGGTQIAELPEIRTSGSDAAIEALLRATRL